MSDSHTTRDSDEEIRELRSRVLELENELAELRAGIRPLGLAAPEDSAAERAIAGFFEQPLVMLFVADLVEGRFLRVNRKVCEVLGYSERELLESSFLDRVHPDDHRKTMLEMERLAAGDKTVEFRNRHRDSDGNYRILEWTAVADADRELCYAMAIEINDS